MIPRSRIEATIRFLNLDRMQAINHERQRDALRERLRQGRHRFTLERDRTASADVAELPEQQP